MRTYNKLPAEEVAQLLRLYAETRDRDLRDRVIEAHLYIAEIVARKFSGRGVDSDDLFQVAALALTKAVDRFDPERGIQFSTFVTPGMVGEVKNYFRDKSRIIRPPRRSAELARIVEAARDRLTQELSRSPRVDEIAEDTNLTEDQVLEGLEMASLQPVSLDMQTDADDEDMKLSNVLGAEERGFSDFETADLLRRGMNKLSPQQQDVIRMRFFENLSQREVAQRMGVSQMTISRTERGALEALRREIDTDNE